MVHLLTVIVRWSRRSWSRSISKWSLVVVPNTWQTKSVRHSDGVPAQTGWGFVEYVPGIKRRICAGDKRRICAGDKRRICAGDKRRICAGDKRRICAGDVPGISVEYVPGISVEYVPGISVEYVPGISVEYVPGGGGFGPPY
ncbi:D-ribose pyranase [Vibrio phage vB_VpS_C2]|nr:D-ribose pyranase [Vibrio phage vB_VpS_C2]